MFESTKELATKVTAAHGDLLVGLRKPSQDVANAFDAAEFADFAYAMKEMGDLIESLLKEYRAKQRAAEQMICQIVVRDNIMGPVETEYVKATPNPTVGISIPGYTKDREAFDACMAGMGIPEMLWKGLERPIARLDYPAVAQYVSDVIASGKPIPPALASFKRTPVLSVRLYGRKGVNE